MRTRYKIHLDMVPSDDPQSFVEGFGKALAGAPQEKDIESKLRGLAPEQLDGPNNVPVSVRLAFERTVKRAVNAYIEGWVLGERVRNQIEPCPVWAERVPLVDEKE